MTTPPVALSIAGSDNSAGAGIQADLKTFSAFGVYGLTAVTCVVAEVPGHVSGIAPVPPEIVAEQVRLSLGTFPVQAVKTGMLYSREIIEAACAALEPFAIAALVVDPVMIATSGAPLLSPDAMDAYRTRLFPRATLVTPNLHEAGALLERSITDLEGMREAGHELCSRFGAAFLLKGGHLPGEAVDLLVTREGAEMEFRAPRVLGVPTHGTGCTLSAAIAAGLASGMPLNDAVACAKQFITRAIGEHHRWTGPEGREMHALRAV